MSSRDPNSAPYTRMASSLPTESSPHQANFTFPSFSEWDPCSDDEQIETAPTHIVLTVTLTTLSHAFPLLMPSIPTQVRLSSAQACRAPGDHKLTQALRDQIFRQTFYQVPSQVWVLGEYVLTLMVRFSTREIWVLSDSQKF